jgi:hypothetical protein
MSTLKVAALVLGCAAALCSPERAVARAYVFTVMVDVRNLHPDVTRGEVHCSVQDGVGDTAHNIGEGAVTAFTLTAGTYSGPVEIRFLPSLGSTAPAVMWKCELWFYPPPGSEVDGRPFHAQQPAQFLSDGGRYFLEKFRRAPGTPFVYRIEGRF